MKFDLFDAMLKMRKEFGAEGEILLSQRPGLGLAVRLYAAANCERYAQEFIIDNHEIMGDSCVGITNLKFERAVSQLKLYTGRA